MSSGRTAPSRWYRVFLGKTLVAGTPGGQFASSANALLAKSSGVGISARDRRSTGSVRPVLAHYAATRRPVAINFENGATLEGYVTRTGAWPVNYCVCPLPASSCANDSDSLHISERRVTAIDDLSGGWLVWTRQ